MMPDAYELIDSYNDPDDDSDPDSWAQEDE
jgi:hypothetical protein